MVGAEVCPVGGSVGIVEGVEEITIDSVGIVAKLGGIMGDLESNIGPDIRAG